MSYTKTNWVNNTTPSINATNLNKIEQGIYDNTENIGNLSSLNTVDKSDIVSSINSIVPTILWTNPSPENPISSTQTINLSSDDYDMLEVFYIQVVSGTLCYSSRFLKGNSTRMRIHTTDGTNVYRGLTYLSDTSYRIDLPYSDTAIANLNSLSIPIYIVGYKTGLFS